MPYNPIPAGPFTRSKVARYTGLSDEVIAHWTKESLLLPLDAESGSGRHKEFDAVEVQKAAVLGRMRSLGCGIDGLRWCSEVINTGRRLSYDLPQVRWGEYYKLGQVLRAYNRFLAGDHLTAMAIEEGEVTRFAVRSLDDILQNHMEISDMKDGTAQAIKALTLKHHNDKIYCQSALLYDYFSPEHILDERVDGIWLIWSSMSGWMVYEDTDVNMTGLAHPPLAGIMLYVTRMLRELWSVVF